jgi:hypothetical protein
MTLNDGPRHRGGSALDDLDLWVERAPVLPCPVSGRFSEALTGDRFALKGPAASRRDTVGSGSMRPSETPGVGLKCRTQRRALRAHTDPQSMIVKIDEVVPKTKLEFRPNFSCSSP